MDELARRAHAEPGAPSSLSKAAAKTALLAFFKPKAGWRGAGAGPIDPALWPTNPATILTGTPLSASPPDRVLTSQWSVADAGTSGDAIVTVSSLEPNVTELAVVVDGTSPIPLAAPLVGMHTVSGLTNFSHSFSLVASNTAGALAGC